MKQLGKSTEDYLETIFLLSKRLKDVRSVDIAHEMGFSKPSVSIAVKKLRSDGHIEVNEFGYILLTEQGATQARRVWDRHRTIYLWLLSLGVSEQNAEIDACNIEHIISEETFLAVRQKLMTDLEP